MWSAILGPLKKIAPCHENETIFVLQCFTRDMHHWLTNCADYCEKQNGTYVTIYHPPLTYWFSYAHMNKNHERPEWSQYIQNVQHVFCNS